MEAFISFSHCYCGKNKPLAFDTVEILNNNIYASFGAGAINLTSLYGQFVPDL